MDKSLLLERKKMRKQLKGIYKKEYRVFQKLLMQDMAADDKFQEVDLGILNLFINAQTEGKSVESIYGKSREDFYFSLLMESGNYSLDERLKLKRSERLLNGWMVSILVVVLLLVKLSYADFYQIKSNGFAYLLKNGAVIDSTEVLKDEIFFELNISDLNENFNKIVYESEDGKIVLESVTKENENIIMHFRGEGVLSNNQKTLVSAIKHSFDENGAATFAINAECSFKLNGNTYICSLVDMTGLNKYGDEFSFELFDASNLVEGQFKDQDALEGKDTITVSMKNLVKTEWK